MASEPALQLAPGADTSGVEVEAHFPNFPGLWKDDQPIAVADLGFADADAAMAAVKEAGVPLELVQVDVGSAPMPVRDNHVANEEQQRTIELATAGDGPKTHAQLDEAAKAAGVEWPVAKMTVNEKTEFLAGYAHGQVDEDGTGEGEA